MENEFIPYEEALALKELGFNEPCFACYDELKENKLSLSTIYSFAPKNATNSNFKFNTYAPLFQQAFNWLQNNLEVDVSITMWQDGSGNLNELHHDEDIFTFENRLECLKQLLTLIKNK
jgi:hypothetical protein